MKGSDLKAIRNAFGLSKKDFAYAMGYSGNSNTLFVMMDRYESGRKPIPLMFARFAWLLDQWRIVSNHNEAISYDAMPSWPHWPGYEEPSDAAQ